MPSRHVIRDPNQLRALVSPLRHHLLRTLSSLGPCPARTLADRLGRAPEGLYYHLRALTKVGLVREEPGPEGESLFSATAPRIATDPTTSDPDYLTALAKSVSALLRLADRQVTAALDHQASEGTPRHPVLRAQQLRVRLTRTHAREAARRIDDLLQFLVDHDDPDAARAEDVAVTMVAAPLADDS